MKILLLADISGYGQEGLKNLAKNYYKYLERSNKVIVIPPKKIFMHLTKILYFNPKIIHMLNGPSVKTFIVLAFLKFFFPNAKYFASLTQVNYNIFKWGFFLRNLNYVKLFSQDKKSEIFFINLGFNCIPLANGIETEKFLSPANNKLPMDLENFFSDNKNKKILLHIGHIKMKRGLEILTKINGYKNWRVLVVGSTHFPAEKKVEKLLVESKIIIYTGYIKNIEEVYKRANAYIFPVTDITGSIDFPLTVLEALVSGLPVVSTRFKALPRFLAEGEGIHYYTGLEELKKILDKIETSVLLEKGKNAEKFNIAKIIEQVIKYYKE